MKHKMLAGKQGEKQEGGYYYQDLRHAMLKLN
jgi:hypothetical protein